MKKIFTYAFSWGSVLVLGIFLGITVKLVGAWVEPEQMPPGGNIAAPLNTGSAGQSKKGGLTLNIGGAQYGLIVANGLVGIGTTTPNEKLTVEGNLSLKEGSSSPATTSGYTKIYSKKVETSYTKLLIHADGNNGSTIFGDSSLSAHGITTNGDTKISTAQFKFGGSSAYFDGNGDYLSVGDSSDFDFGSGDFTVDFWVNASDLPTPGNYVSLYTNWDDNISANKTIGIWFYNNSGTYQASVYYNNGSVNSVTRDFSITTGSWYHFALVRSGSVGKIFWNGTQLGSDFSLSGTLNNSPVGPLIGSSMINNNPNYYLKGYVDELRVSKGIARWISNFTPSTVAYIVVDSNSARLYYKNGQGTEYLIGGDGSGNTNANINVNDVNGNMNVNGDIKANNFIVNNTNNSLGQNGLCLNGDCKNSWPDSGSGVLTGAQWEWNCSPFYYNPYDNNDTICSYDFFITDPKGDKEYLNSSCYCYSTYCSTCNHDPSQYHMDYWWCTQPCESFGEYSIIRKEKDCEFEVLNCADSCTNGFTNFMANEACNPPTEPAGDGGGGGGD